MLSKFIIETVFRNDAGIKKIKGVKNFCQRIIIFVSRTVAFILENGCFQTFELLLIIHCDNSHETTKKFNCVHSVTSKIY